MSGVTQQALPVAPALAAMGRVLVTGAGGFIGRHLVAALRTLGKDVVTASRSGGFDLLTGELPVAGVEHVFHLAARTGVPEAWREPVDFYRVNALGTVRVLDQCRRRGCSLTYVSAYVYGVPDRLPIAETAPPAANNPYAFSKLQAEAACRFYADAYGLTVTILRLFNVYGPGQGERFLIPRILRQVLAADCPEVVVADLAPRRDYVYVTDTVEALLLSVRAGAPGMFNVGSGESHSVREIIRVACQAAGVDKPFRATGESRPNEIMDVVADTTLIAQTCGWRPRTSIEEGLRHTLRNGLVS